MQHADQIHEQAIVGPSVNQKKFCKQCFREDYHVQVAYSPVLLGFLVVVTLGLALLIRPYRCVCCGNTRLN